jgi:hypothetical protein
MTPGETMSIFPDYPRYIKSVEYASLTLLLHDFRRKLEHESGGPIDELNVNAAEVISDLCNFVGLSDQNRRRVLGANGAQHVDMIEHSSINSTIKH